jgi:hypothetical protein
MRSVGHWDDRGSGQAGALGWLGTGGRRAVGERPQHSDSDQSVQAGESDRRFRILGGTPASGVSGGHGVTVAVG